MAKELIYDISIILISMTGIIIATFFYNGLFQKKAYSTFIKILGFLSMTVVSTGAYLLSSDLSINTPMIFMFYFLIAIILYQGKLHMKIVASIFILVFSLVCEILTVLLLVWIFKYEISEVRENLAFLITGGIISKLLLFILIRVIVSISERNASKVSVSSWILITSIPIVSIYLIIQIVYENVVNKELSVDSIFISCIVLYINLTTFYLFDCIIRHTEENNQYLFVQNQLLMQKDQYKSIISGYKKVKSLKHDMLNHLITLDSYIENEKNQKAHEYIKNLNGYLDESSKEVISGNVVIDAMINSKKSAMHKREILFDVKVNVPSRLNINDMDICTIMGNALDNAIEACERISDMNIVKSIQLKIKYVDGTFLLIIRNTYNKESLKVFGGRYVSEKRRSISESDGLGILNIESTVKKYNGNIKISVEDLFFNLKILIVDKIS